MALVERADQCDVRIITLNRPGSYNALTMDLLEKLHAEFSMITAERSPRCLVVTGAGKGFCAGADLKEENPDREFADRWFTTFQEALRLLFRLPCPTLAMVNGPAVGGGLELALACDFRFAAEEATFRGFGHLGLPPEGGGSWTMPRLVGLERAKRFHYADEIWLAEQACEYGLVSEVFPSAELRSASLEFASRLASRPKETIRMVKGLVDSTYSRSFEEALEAEATVSALCQKTEDCQAIWASVAPQMILPEDRMRRKESAS